MLMEWALHIIAGAAVGFAVGLTGVGGGSLMTPLLLMFGYPAPVAIGTDLLYAAVTKSGGVIAHQRKRTVNWRVVALLAAGSLPCSLVLNFFVLDRNFQQSQRYEELLTFSLGVMLIVTAMVLVLRRPLREKAEGSNQGPVMAFMHRHAAPTTLVMGAFLGICVTLSSVGAGAFGAAILLVIYSRMPALQVIATDLAHAVPLTLIAGLGYLYHGFVDFQLLVSLLIGSLPAIWLGTHVGARLSPVLLQNVLVSILLAMGIKYTFF